MNKKILISLFTVGVLSSTAFAKVEQMSQQDDIYSYVLGIAQTQKDFLGISAIHNEPNGLALQLKASQGKTQQPILLNQSSFFNPSSSSMQAGVKNINFQQMVVSKATYELPELSEQLTSTSSDVQGTLTRAVRDAKAQVVASPFQLATDSTELDGLSTRDTADSAIQFRANSSKATDLSDGETTEIKPQGTDSAIQLTDDSSNVTDLLDQSTRNIQHQLDSSSLQLAADFSGVADFSDQDIGAIQAQLVGSPTQLTADSFERNKLVEQNKIDTTIQLASSTAKPSLPPPPPVFSAKAAANLGQVKKGAGFNFGDVIGQLKAQMNGSGLRSTSTVSQGKNDKSPEISLGQMGTISGKEAQKFADRWAKLREAADANSSTPVSGKGDGSKKVDVSTPKVSVAKKPVSFSARALSLQKKVANPISSGSFADQLKQAKLNKAVINEATNKTTTSSPNLKGDLLKELKKGKSLNHVDVTTAKNVSEDALISIEDLETKLANTKDMFFRKQIQRQINEMKAEAITSKVENNPVVIEDSSLLPVTLLPLINSNEDKDSVLPVSLPTLAKPSTIQEKEEIVQLGGFSFNAAMFKNFKQEATNEVDDENNSEWDEEDDTPVAVAKIINPIVLKPEIQEEVIVKSVTPKVGRLAIKTRSGGDWLAQIKAARTRIEAVEVDQVKIQAVLDAENIRIRKKEQEERERELQERQIAKLNPKKENSNDDLGSALIGALTKRAAAIHGNDEDEDDAW